MSMQTNLQLVFKVSTLSAFAKFELHMPLIEVLHQCLSVRHDSLHFNGHCPGGPGLVDTRIS